MEEVMAALAGIGIGTGGDAADAETPTGLDDPVGDLTSIGEEDLGNISMPSKARPKRAEASLWGEERGSEPVLRTCGVITVSSWACAWP
jgi:hypothetical protein